MKNLVILGAGTSGTMMSNHLISKLPKDEWRITIVDQYKTHYYQPGFLFLPFDIYSSKQVKKNGKKFIPKGVNYIQEKIELITPEANKVELSSGTTLDYDILIIATGTKIAPDEIEGMNSPEWHKITTGLQRILLPYPEACERVAEFLKELDRQEALATQRPALEPAS